MTPEQSIETKTQKYPINQSPLYNLLSKKRLSKLLHIPLPTLEELVNRPDNHRIFYKETGGKWRFIEEPKKTLEKVHRRLFMFLCRIKTPPYLHSGTKGRSHLTNAEVHIPSQSSITIDIRKFFYSTKGWHVFLFFKKTMKCSDDVSAILTKACTVNNHVPLGSCISQPICFFCHLEMLSEISNLCSENNLTMTCYVDDITISGDRIGNHIVYQVQRLLRRQGLDSHSNSERASKRGRPFLVTGVIVSKFGIRLPNKKHKLIYESIKSLEEKEITTKKVGLLNSTIGRASAAIPLHGPMKRTLFYLQTLKKKMPIPV